MMMKHSFTANLAKTFPLLGLLVLIGCRAELVEIKIDEEQLDSVLQGNVEMISFEASFSNFGELDENQKQQTKQAENIIEDYIDIDDFEVKTGDYGFEVLIEGEIPMSQESPSNSAYYIKVTKNELIDGLNLVEFKTTSTFAEMYNRLQDVDYFFAPEKYHPLDIRLKAENMRVIVPAAEIDGEAKLLTQFDIEDKKMRLTFKGGIFDDIGGGFLFQIPN